MLTIMIDAESLELNEYQYLMDSASLSSLNMLLKKNFKIYLAIFILCKLTLRWRKNSVEKREQGSNDVCEDLARL